MKWYLKVIKQYADFKGRARRKEYWMFVLLHLLFSIIAMIIDRQIIGYVDGDLSVSPIYLIYVFVMIIPSIAVAVRRLHDTGKSGLTLLVGLIPIIGTIWILVLLITKGDLGENKYGIDPKGEKSE